MINIAHLRAAAEILTTDDDPAADTIKKVAVGAFDRHSHSSTCLGTTSHGLVAKLRFLGHEAEATFLDAMGRGWEAVKFPGFSEDERTTALHHLSLVIHRIFGPSLCSPKVLNSKSLRLGMASSLLIDLLANIDARVGVLKNLSAEKRRRFHDSSTTTRTNESNFSELARDKKPILENLIGVVQLSDTVTAIREDEANLLTSQKSKRKRKDESPSTNLWGTSSPSVRLAYRKDLHSRAKQHTAGFSSVRDHNARAGGVR